MSSIDHQNPLYVDPKAPDPYQYPKPDHSSLLVASQGSGTLSSMTESSEQLNFNHQTVEPNQRADSLDLPLEPGTNMVQIDMKDARKDPSSAEPPTPPPPQM